jgi:uncharacterized repeat protein (TIGR01451 family)
LYHETKFLTPINFIFMKRLILILCVLCFHGFAFGQGWQRILSDSMLVSSTCNDYDGGYLITGKFQKNAALGIIKTDKNGKKIWSKQYTNFSESLNYNNHIIQSVDSFFLLYGINYNNVCILKKMDKNGNFLWTKELPLDNPIVKQNRNEYIIVGKSQILSSDVLLRVNFKGDTIFHKITGISLGTFEVVNDGILGINLTDNSLVKIDWEGNIIWKKYVVPNSSAWLPRTKIILLEDSSFIGLHGAFISKNRKNGDNIWVKNFEVDYAEKGITGNAEFIKVKGGLIVMPRWSVQSRQLNSDEYYKIDNNGTVLWKQKFPTFDKSVVMWTIIQCNNGGYLMVGNYDNDGLNNGGDNLPLLIKISDDGLIYPNILEGKTTNDLDKNCQKSNADKPLKSCIVEAKKSTGETFWGISDSIGNYFINIDSGAYNIKAYRSQSTNLWQPCTPSVSKTFSSLKKTDTIDFLLKPIIDCPSLNVQISTPFLRRCFNNTYTVNYCNRGTVKAQNAYVTVTLDSLLEYISSSKSITSQAGRTLRINLGDVAVDDCGSFDITTRVRCGDSTRLGQTLCVEAKIYPDTVCSDLSLWSGASMEITGSCQKDSVLFQIKNVGRAPSSSLNSIVIEDEVLFLRQPVQLPQNGVFSKKFPANGKTWRMVVNQEPNHPSSYNPTAFVEGCRANNSLPFSTGFATRFPNDDKATTIDVDCQIIQGAFDPNDKIGYPTGYKNEHFVAQNQDIEYKIRFQNTGTDTAFTVVIRDTISDKLDISSIEFETSSHKYEAEIYGKGILKFTFNNINLVDSFKNEPKSHGFVQYRIKQKKDLAWGSKIYNSAGIYFDFNDPVLTNQTLHTVGAREIISAVVERTIEPNFPVKISPNPFSESAVFEGPLSPDCVGMSCLHIQRNFELFDMTGKMLRNEAFVGTTFEFHRKGLTAGIYIFKILEGGKLLSVGKLIVQ